MAPRLIKLIFLLQRHASQLYKRTINKYLGMFFNIGDLTNEKDVFLKVKSVYLGSLKVTNSKNKTKPLHSQGIDFFFFFWSEYCISN